MEEKTGLPTALIANIKSIFRRYATIKEVIVFGSRSKGTFREDSDIDLTFKGDNLTAAILSDVMTDIEKLKTPYLFDISLYDSIKEGNLKQLIDCEGQLFYSRSK